VMLETVSGLVVRNPTIVTISVLVLFIQTLWLGLFSLTCVQVLSLELYHLLYLYLFFSYFWTTQVLKNIVHTSVAGTIAHWYFGLSGGSQLGITLQCFQKSLSVYLGAISLGSLLVAPIHMLWAFASFCNEWKGCGFCCSKFSLLFQSLFHQFNPMAFTHVIVYGKEFRRASNDGWELFLSKGADAIIAEDKLTALLLFPAIGGGCVVASICAVWARYLDLSNWFIISFMVFWVGYSTVALTTEIIQASAMALITCFSIDDNPLSVNDALMYQRFTRICEFHQFRNRQTTV